MIDISATSKYNFVRAMGFVHIRSKRNISPISDRSGKGPIMRKTSVRILGVFFFTLFVICPIVMIVSGELTFAKARAAVPIKSLFRTPVPFSHVHLSGELGSRYIAATCNLLTRTDRYSLESFAANAAGRSGALWPDWPGDQFGRWFSVLHVAEGYGWSRAAGNREDIARVVLPLQTREGNFGPPGSAAEQDDRIVSGNAFALRGLMDAFVDTRDSRYLEAARRLGRYFEAVAPSWEARGQGASLHEFFGHCLDGLVALYEHGGDKWALDLAQRLAVRAGRTAHTHHSLSLCRGLVDLARVTGDREPLKKVEDYLIWCREHQTVTGGLPEAMPQSPQDEGCGLADWIVVNLLMFQATGENRYLDDAEHTLVNHFFMNQFHTGGFGHRSLTQKIIGGKGWQGWNGQFGSENPGCCSLWGQWGLGQVGRLIVTESADTIEVNLYPSAEIILPDRGVRLEISGDFPRMTQALIRIVCTRPQSFTLALRIPSWAGAVDVECEGKSIPKVRQGERALLRRTWRNSETVAIRFGGELRSVPWPPSQPEGVAVFDGPLCLGLSGRVADPELDWAVRVGASGRPLRDKDGQLRLVESSGRIMGILEPISADWLVPDVKDPHRWRILFRTKPGGAREPRQNL